MAYVKHVWVDENVQYPDRYLVDGQAKTITRSVGNVVVQDAISASKLNNMEQGIYDAHQKIDTPDTGTLQLTPTTSNQSLTDSYSGVIDVEVGGATINNLPKNGDFADTSEWTPSSATFTVLGNVGKITGNGGDPYPQIYQQIAPNSVVGNKYFDKIRARVTTAYTGAASIGLAIQGTTGLIVASVLNPGVNQWYDLKNIVTIDGTFTGPLKLVIYTEYANASTAIGKILEIEGLDTNGGGVFSIPMTGTPYESYTADQMNALVNEYGEGLISTNEVEINTSGKNFIDKNKVKNGYRWSDTGNGLVQIQDSSFDLYDDYISTRGATNYSYSNGTIDTVFFLDQYKKVISTVFSNSFTTPSNAKFVTFRFLSGSNFDNDQFEEGVATSYQPYKSSKITVKCTNKAKFELSQLPNGIKNEVNQVKGYISAVKRIGAYTLKSVDIINIVGLANVALAFTNSNFKSDMKKGSDGNTTGQVMIDGLTETFLNARDSVSNVGKFYLSSDGTLAFIYPLGTTLVQAQTALAGTETLYQLATPSFIPYEDFGENGIEIDGMLACNDGYTNVNYTGDSIPNVTLEYPRNLSASVDGLTHAIANAFEILTDHEQRIDVLEIESLGKMSLQRFNKDSFGIWIQLEYKRKDGTLYKTSLLSGGTAPTYSTRTENYYGADGLTITSTNIYALSYSGGDLVSEVLQ